MQEDLVSKLERFGFTTNQAKVYLSIVQSGKTRVGRISKNTSLHRQDIYKLLPKLEKMGLITKTIDKPFMIEAIPIEKALESLITKEKDKAYERINGLETDLKEMIKEIQKQPELKEEARFTLLTTDEAIKNRGRSTFKKTKKEFCMITTVDQISKPGHHHFREYLQTIADINAKIQIVIVSPENEETVKQTVDKILPDKGQLSVRWLKKSGCKNCQIIDNKEVWIGIQQKTESGYPCILWTNDNNIVDTYKESFQALWNNPKAVTLYDTKLAKAFVSSFREPIIA
jgi:sugar-specific transcriptional regulator TrmB